MLKNSNIFVLIILSLFINFPLSASALDHQTDRSNVTTFMTDRTRNENAARRILEGWAGILTNGLDETLRVVSGRSEG